MDNVIAIGVGLALRTVIDILTDSDYRLTGTLIGLWEGFVLSHFLHKNPRNPNDAYLALATRFAIDFFLTNSLIRLALTGAWTIVGLLLADIMPSLLRETGLRHVYRALRKDARAMRRSMPRWRIENDIQVPNISILNRVPDLSSRTSASTIVSSTRAAPPASPAPTVQRRSTSDSPSSQVTSSVANTLTREVLLGPSPALIHIDVAPDFPPSNPDPSSDGPSLLSNTSGSDSSRHDQAVSIPDDDRVHAAMPPLIQEQEQEQDPDLSVLDFTPPVAAFGITITSEIISPTPRSYIGVLPPIPDSEIDLSVHAPPVPPPESRPASRVRNLSSTSGAGIWSQNARTGVGEGGTDRCPDLGNARAPLHQRASSAGLLGQLPNQPTFGNQPNSTGHQASSKWENSRLRHPEQVIMSDGAAGIGGFAMRADGQMPQHSGTPQTHSGSDGVRTSSVLGLTSASAPQTKPPTPAPLIKPPTPAPLTKPPTPAPLIKPPTPAPLTKPPTPAPLTKPPTPAPSTNLKQTNTTLQPNSKSINEEPRSTTPAPALPSKTPTPAPLSRTHTPMPTSKSRCTSPGLTSTSVRNFTDYDPANPIRPMPGLKSPSTEPDPIFPGAGARHESATGEFNLLDTGVDIDDDPPPPFKEFESPVHPRGTNFGGGVGNGKGSGGQVTESSRDAGTVTAPPAAEGDAQGEGQDGVSKGEVDGVGGQDSGEVTQRNIETSGAEDHARDADSPDQEESARDKGKDSQEQEKSKQDGDGNQGAVDKSQAACEDANLASGGTQDTGPDLKPEPTRLTPAQEEAETHRNAFLLKEVARLEELRKREVLDSSDEQCPSEIQTRLSAVKGRMSRIIFADPPEQSPPTSEISSVGKSPQDLNIALTNTIIDLLLERQDVGPIQVTVSNTKNKHKAVEKLLKEFIVENKFSIRSETGQYWIVITV